MMCSIVALAIVAQSAVYHIAVDASGVPWQSQDRAYLDAWIAGRNSAIEAAKPKAAPKPRPGECGCTECKCVPLPKASLPAVTPAVPAKRGYRNAG